MNEPNVFQNPCAICKRREATQLCDYIIEYDNSIMFMRDWRMYNAVNSYPKNETCDLPLCKDCAKSTGVNVDLCPYHFKLHQKVELPVHLRLAQARSKGRIYSINNTR